MEGRRRELEIALPHSMSCWLMGLLRPLAPVLLCPPPPLQSNSCTCLAEALSRQCRSAGSVARQAASLGRQRRSAGSVARRCLAGCCTSWPQAWQPWNRVGARRPWQLPRCTTDQQHEVWADRRWVAVKSWLIGFWLLPAGCLVNTSWQNVWGRGTFAFLSNPGFWAACGGCCRARQDLCGDAGAALLAAALSGA